MLRENDIKNVRKLFNRHHYVMTTAELLEAKLYYADIKQLLDEGFIERKGNKIKLLSTEEKYKNTIISFSKANAVRSTVNNGYKIQDDDWFTVSGSIFKKDNWKQLKVQNDVLLEE